MAAAHINFVKQIAGVIIPTNHSLALLKSYYRNRYRHLDIIANNDKLRQHMCMQCSTEWRDGYCTAKIIPIKNRKIKNISKKLKDKKKKEKEINNLIIECTVCKNLIKMKLKNFKKIKRSQNISKSVNIIKSNEQTKLKVRETVTLKDPKLVIQQKNLKQINKSNKVSKTKQKNFLVKAKPQQNHKIKAPIVGKITNKKKNHILHLAALLKTNVKQNNENKNQLQKLLK